MSRNRQNVLYYSPSLNRFLDSDTIVVHDLYVLFDTWKLDVWKAEGCDGNMTARDGTVFELRYLTPEEEDDMYDFLGFQDSFNMRTDRARY